MALKPAIFSRRLVLHLYKDLGVYQRFGTLPPCALRYLNDASIHDTTLYNIPCRARAVFATRGARPQCMYEYMSKVQ